MGTGYDLYAGDDAAALALLAACDQGHLTVWDAEAGRPELTFLHYVLPQEPEAAAYRRAGTMGQLWGHVANTNPMLEPLAAHGRATFTVSGPTAYVPSYWSDPQHGVPTSYYGWAQCEVEVERVHEPTALLALLRAMLARLQPEGRHPAMDPGERYWQGMLGAITGLRMHVRTARCRFKYGQNKPAALREQIAAHLDARGQGEDAAVAAWVRHFLPRETAEQS